MRRLIPAVLAALVLGPVAQADDKHHPAEGAKPPAAATALDQRFSAAYDQMKKTMALMEQIKANKDPKERARLMQQHLDSTQAPAARMDMMEKRMDMMQMMMEKMAGCEGMKAMPKQERGSDGSQFPSQ